MHSHEDEARTDHMHAASQMTGNTALPSWCARLMNNTHFKLIFGSSTSVGFAVAKQKLAAWRYITITEKPADC